MNQKHQFLFLHIFKI